jgi:hypothetical protein
MRLVREMSRWRRPVVWRKDSWPLMQSARAERRAEREGAL